jgi:hypothetical protein
MVINYLNNAIKKELLKISLSRSIRLDNTFIYL